MSKVVLLTFLTFFYIHSECQSNETVYSYPTKDSLYRVVQEDIDFIQFVARDTVADVGTFNGYFPALYSLFVDSVLFYLEDTSWEKFLPFDYMLASYKTAANSRTQNEFKIVVGNDTATTLPKSTFSKVIVRDALHHFKLRENMLQDVKRILKSDGKLFLLEPLKGKESNKKLCQGTMTKKELLSLLDQEGFKLQRESDWKDVWCWFKFKVEK